MTNKIQIKCTNRTVRVGGQPIAGPSGAIYKASKRGLLYDTVKGSPEDTGVLQQDAERFLQFAGYREYTPPTEAVRKPPRRKRDASGDPESGGSVSPDSADAASSESPDALTAESLVGEFTKAQLVRLADGVEVEYSTGDTKAAIAEAIVTGASVDAILEAMSEAVVD